MSPFSLVVGLYSRDVGINFTGRNGYSASGRSRNGVLASSWISGLRPTTCTAEIFTYCNLSVVTAVRTPNSPAEPVPKCTGDGIEIEAWFDSRSYLGSYYTARVPTQLEFGYTPPIGDTVAHLAHSAHEAPLEV